MTRLQIFNTPLTPEDFEIWLRVVRASSMPADLWGLSELQDRSDADLMFDNVEHQVSAVVQAESGDWGYWVHNSVCYRGGERQ